LARDSISPGADDVCGETGSSRMTDTIPARMIETIFLETLRQYPDVECPKYVIMPNHLHAIIVIHKESRADIESVPTATATIPNIIQAFKRHSTIEYIKLVNEGIAPPFYEKIWQRSYYDHIIRDEQEYRKIWRYIDDNPANWRNDPTGFRILKNGYEFTNMESIIRGPI